MKKILILIIGVLIATIKSNACNCEDPGTVTEAFTSTSYVVQGKVINKEFVTIESTMNKKMANKLKGKLRHDKQKLELLNAQFILKVELEIKKIYKGKIKKEVMTIYTTRTSASCGFTKFETGSEFIVYASTNSYAYWPFNQSMNKDKKYEKANTFWTNQCTRTTEYDLKEAEELAILSNK